MNSPSAWCRLLQATLGCNLASFAKLGNSPRRFYRACKQSYEGARDASTDALARIPVASLEELLGDRRPEIQLRVTGYEDGALPTHEVAALLAVLVGEAPAEVLEIGTYMGYTARAMAENLPVATIHTVDLPEGFLVAPENEAGSSTPKDDFGLIEKRVVGREFKNQPCAARIRQHFADSATWDFSLAGRPTFFFIDGSHTYEYCKSDSEKSLALCGGNGVFLWHDCDNGHPGVVRFLDEWRQQGKDIRRIRNTAIAHWKARN